MRKFLSDSESTQDPDSFFTNFTSQPQNFLNNGDISNITPTNQSHTQTTNNFNDDKIDTASHFPVNDTRVNIKNITIPKQISTTKPDNNESLDNTKHDRVTQIFPPQNNGHNQLYNTKTFTNQDINLPQSLTKSNIHSIPNTINPCYTNFTDSQHSYIICNPKNQFHINTQQYSQNIVHSNVNHISTLNFCNTFLNHHIYNNLTSNIVLQKHFSTTLYENANDNKSSNNSTVNTPDTNHERLINSLNSDKPFQFFNNDNSVKMITNDSNESNINNTQNMPFLEKVKLGIVSEPFPDIDENYPYEDEDDEEEEVVEQCHVSTTQISHKMINVDRPSPLFINYKSYVSRLLKDKRFINTLNIQSGIFMENLTFAEKVRLGLASDPCQNPSDDEDNSFITNIGKTLFESEIGIMNTYRLSGEILASNERLTINIKF